MDLSKEPRNLDDFYRKYPSFIWGPALVGGGVMAICKALPARLDKLQATPYGWQASALYAVYGGVLSFAVHGWYCTFVDRERQLQTYEKRGTPFSGTMEDRISYREKEQPRVAAIRQLATFATSLVYSVYPFASATTSWLSFVAWTCALAVYWDIHFFIVHKIAHENKHAYKWLHKLHHTYKQPTAFSVTAIHPIESSTSR